MEPALSRETWRRLETVNAVTYFAEECRDAMRELGLRGFWMGYFAARAGAIAGPIATSGVIPFPNPMGLPPPSSLVRTED